MHQDLPVKLIDPFVVTMLSTVEDEELLLTLVGQDYFNSKVRYLILPMNCLTENQ